MTDRDIIERLRGAESILGVWQLRMKAANIIEDQCTTIERLTAREQVLVKALERSIVAIDDWLHLFAGEFCNEADVLESKKRVYEHGTLSYISEVQSQIRAALSDGGGKNG